MEKILKPWGFELIWAKTNHYVGKILHIKAGESLSLQYHCIKDETIMVLTGKIMFEYFSATDFFELKPSNIIELLPYQSFHITPELRHRMTAIEDTDIAEVSTTQLDDVVRIEDRYGRVKTR